MGSYISQTDVEDIFGQDNVAKWSQLDNDVITADTSRITKSITYAEETVNDRFSNSRWDITTGTVSEKVKEWSAKLAGIWLYENRGIRDTNTEGNKFTSMKDDVNEEINKYLSGESRLNATAHDGSAPTAPFIVQ